MEIDKLSQITIGCAIEVHKALGPGLLESAYRECLYYELCEKGLYIEKEKPIPLIYKEVKLGTGYRIDILADNSLIIEIKSVDELNNIHLAQVLTYLKLSKLKLGLLINFNVTKLVNGIKRVIN